MEAPHDGTKIADNMMNFSGSASDMLATMAAAGIVMPEAEEAAEKVAASPPSAPAAACEDPSCTIDHGHSGHDHGHSHGHSDAFSDNTEGGGGAANLCVLLLSLCIISDNIRRFGNLR